METPADQQPPTEDQTLEQVVETVAENGLVLTGEDGQPIPLASQEAVETLQNPDPWFMMGSTRYSFMPVGQCAVFYPGDVNCVENANPIQAALDFIKTGKVPSDGVLHLESYTFNLSANLLIDGNDPYLSKLTAIVGAGSGNNPSVPGKTTLAFANGYNLTVDKMPGNFRLEGLMITGNINGALLNMTANKGAITLKDMDVRNTGGVGVSLTTQGAISLDSVESSNNGGNGMSIQATGFKPITIINSEFDDNTGMGLSLVSWSAVTMNSVSASNNGKDGAQVSYFGSLTVRDSVFRNNGSGDTTIDGFGLKTVPFIFTPTGNVIIERSIFNNNDEAGLYLLVDGNVTINDIRAYREGQVGEGLYRNGIYVDTCNRSTGDCQTINFPGNVTITNYRVSGQTHSGIHVVARGAITLKDGQSITSATGSGADLNNRYNPSGAPGVTVTNSVFENNNQTALVVKSKGAITLTSVTGSSSANGSGADLDNSTGTAGVTLNGSATAKNYFQSNVTSGLKILTKGSVVVNWTEAGITQNIGIDIDNTGGTGNVTLSNVIAVWNKVYGLKALSKGNITLTNVNASYSVDDDEDARGAKLDNSTASSPRNVTITASQFSHNFSYGLEILSKGFVTLTGVTASSNNGGVFSSRGVLINNASGLGVSILGSAANPNAMSNNDYHGVEITSNGPVRLDFVTASSNGQSGVIINTPGNVTLNACTANYNILAGYSIKTQGAVVVNNTTGSYNQGMSGITIQKQDAATTQPRSVSISNSVFNSNTSGDGITILSSGVIALLNTSADSNTNYGVNVDNIVTGSAPGVSIICTGANTCRFNDNGASGVSIKSHGSVTLKQVQAVSNGTTNIHIGVDGTNRVAAVTLTNVNTTMSDAGHGLAVYASGAISVTNLTASDNVTVNRWGAVLNNNVAGSTAPVTITGAILIYNANNLNITSRGAITLTNVQVNYATVQGAMLDNHEGLANVTLNSTRGYTNSFSNNGSTGLSIVTMGAVVLNRVEANSNYAGVYIENDGGVANVTIKTGEFDLNTDDNGLYVATKGAILITNLTANQNGGNGVYLENNGSATPKPVTITTGQASNNTADGVYIITKGAVTLTNVRALTNGMMGVEVIGATTVNVTSTGAYYDNFSDNTGNGLSINASGAVKLQRVIIKFNDGPFGLMITTNGSVTILSSEVNNSTDIGASLGTSGAYCGAVSITGSTFNANGADGLSIFSGGTVLLNTVTANENTGYGAYIAMNTQAAAATISGSNFNYNGQTNLRLTNLGPITFTNVDASNSTNGLGALLSNSGATVAAKVTITCTGKNTCDFSTNGMSGLVITSKGAISLTRVYASNNEEAGASLDNNTGAAGVSLVNSQFVDNDNSGLLVTSNGAVLLNTITANDNGDSDQEDNALVDNHLGTNQPVTVINSTFNLGYRTGLRIYSSGLVTLTDTLIRENHYLAGSGDGGGNGVFIDNSTGTAGITIKNKNLSAYGIFNNQRHGLMITTRGPVSLTNLAVEGNGMGAQTGYGVGINLSPQLVMPPVTVTNCQFNDNDGFGMHAPYVGKTIIASTTSSYNVGYGIRVNGVNAGAGTTVSVMRSKFEYNTGVGLHISTTSLITLNNITANGNEGGNLYARNTGFLYSDESGMKILGNMGANTFTGSTGDGIYLSSNGPVVIERVTANDNYLAGANVTSDGPVTVSNSVFNGNNVSNSTFTYGLEISAATGGITLNSVTASSNRGVDAYGAHLTATQSGTGTLTITRSIFNSNQGGGLLATVHGLVTLNNITANDNAGGEGGVHVINNDPSLAGIVVLNSMGVNSTSNNVGSGMALFSNGSVEVRGLTTNDNTGRGLDIDVQTGNPGAVDGTNGAVSLLGITAMSNGGRGVSVLAFRNISANGIRSIENGSDGLYLDNDPETGTTNITSVMNSTVVGNNGYGIFADTGTFTLLKTTYFGNNINLQLQ